LSTLLVSPRDYITTGSIAVVRSSLATLPRLLLAVSLLLSLMLNPSLADLDNIMVALVSRELIWRILDLLVLLDLTSKEDNSPSKL